MADYGVASREDAIDFMEQYPGFGEMRSFTDALGAEEVAFTWRLMPPNTGGKGSYGHRHKDQEEVYFVVRGTVQFKLGDEVIEVGPRSAVRVPTDVFRSVHNDGPDDAEIVLVSVRLEDLSGETDTVPDFWPE